jgi:Flp pilus assembly protein TadG
VTARRDSGSVTLEIAILAPVLLFMVFTIVQVSLWSFARSLAQAAAQEGASAGAAHGAAAGAAVARVQHFLLETGGDSLTAVAVGSGGSTATTVRIEVRGRALSVLPGVPGLTVTEVAQAPLERFTTDAAP